MITDAPAIHPARNSTRYFLVTVLAAAVTFSAYSCVYAFRKPFTVAQFNGYEFWGIPYQSLLIIAQGIGYMLSKFFGIKMIAELKRFGRWKTIVILLGVSWAALLGFAITPPPYGVIFLFINGFPLGFLWGIIFSYVEGRRATDFIGSAMAISFIFAGGFTRSVAKFLLVEWHVSENWMPFAAGLIFCLPAALFVFLLEKIPAPDNADMVERTERMPMKGAARSKFLKLFGSGVLSVTIAYVLLTLMRDIRDNFMSNIWIELGYVSDFSVFTKTEIRTSLIVLLMMACLVLIKKNIIAFRIIHWIVVCGLVVCGVSSVLFMSGNLHGYLWMQLMGLGLYMAYVPFNCIFFERLIASFKIKGNVGFLIYFADAFGYLGSSILMCGKAWYNVQMNWSQVFSQLSVVASIAGIICVLISLYYFDHKYSNQK
jgi:hypothetical protein